MVKRIWDRLKGWVSDYIHNAVGYPIAAALAAACWAFISKQSLPVIATMAGAASFLAWSIYASFMVLSTRPLRKWKNLTPVTDLIGFEERNEGSCWMPDKILERKDIRDLAVMGNGCSKWTICNDDVEEALVVQKLGEIRRQYNDAIRFLASCPKSLSERTGERDEVLWMRKKAIHNAKSLLKLREFKRRTESSGGRFEIRTYKHLATLRLIVINKVECIVGHYREDGRGQSFDTPLMIFRCMNPTEWGFGHAFSRLFDHEWYRAAEPTDAEWAFMEKLAREPSPTDLGY